MNKQNSYVSNECKKATNKLREATDEVKRSVNEYEEQLKQLNEELKILDEKIVEYSKDEELHKNQREKLTKEIEEFIT